MKLKMLTAAVAVACANGAMALTPANLPADLELFIGGASAQDNGLKEVVTSLCDDTVHAYSETGTIPGRDYTAYFCTMSSAKVPGFPAGGLKVLVHKRSKGGSAFGAAPVEAKDSVLRMNVVNDATCAVFSGNNYRCTGTTSSVLNAGITDVEPSLFRGTGVNLLKVGIGGVVAGDPGTSPMTTAQLARLDKKPVAALTFGPVVTKNLRDALQAAQGLTAGSDEESQMPSLSRTQYVSLVAGTIANWGEFKVGGTALTTAPGVTPPTDATVRVCRRTEGSGTQAVSNQAFLNQPCAGDVFPKADNTAGSQTAGTGNFTSLLGVPAGNPAIHWNESSGNVDTCLTAINTGGYWGIGFQSLEKTNAAYRFVKVEGNSPLLENVAKTKYDVVGITSFQWIKSTEADGLAGNQLILASKIRDDIGRDTELRTANNTFGGANILIGGVPAVGKVGFAALASNGYTLNTPFDETKPVVPFSNRGTGGTGEANSCSAKVILGGSSQL